MKVGDIVKIKEENDYGYAGMVARIFEVREGYSRHIVELQSGERLRLYEDKLEPHTQTLEDLFVGDEIVDDSGERMILGVCGRAYIISYACEFERAATLLYTGKELKKIGYEIRGQESDTVEIKVEGNTKTISRQSAKELGLI